jgi:hypothetical protein
MTTPAPLAQRLDALYRAMQIAFPSKWTRNGSAPAATHSSRKKSGSEIIKCVSKDRRVTRRTDCTIGAPIKMFGHKYPFRATTPISASLRLTSSAFSIQWGVGSPRVEYKKRSGEREKLLATYLSNWTRSA